MVFQEFMSISEGFSERVSDCFCLSWKGAEAEAEAGGYSQNHSRNLIDKQSILVPD